MDKTRGKLTDSKKSKKEETARQDDKKTKPPLPAEISAKTSKSTPEKTYNENVRFFHF